MSTTLIAGTTPTTYRPAPAQCRAFIEDGTLPSNTSQVRQCRNTATADSRWCSVHERRHQS